MKRCYQLLCTLSCLILFGFCKTPDSSNSNTGVVETVITNVNVLPMTQNTILKNQNVIIREGKIHKIGSANKVKPSNKATIIDGSGKFLMPGISEMHAHIPIEQEGDDARVKETLFLYLSNGITTIRGMLGNPYHLKLKEQIAKGEILSPRVYTSSPSMNGNSVTSKEEARQKVTQYKQDGYDFLKIHPGIRLDVFEVLVNTAREVGIPFSGHVPVEVGINKAIEFGYASVDHLDGYVDGLVRNDAKFDPNAGGFFGLNFTKLVDVDKIPGLAQKTKKANVWIVPTQSLMVRWASPKPVAEMLQEPGMAYVSPGTRIQWRQQKQAILDNPFYDPATADRFIEIRQKMLKELHTIGAGLLLGSDAPQVFNVPGFSIQHEMQSIVDAGISAYETLKSGTANPAQFFGQTGEYGTIVEGASADLILLEANPLDDIANMRKNAGVMVRGQWLSKEEIDKRLAEIAEKYKS